MNGLLIDISSNELKVINDMSYYDIVTQYDLTKSVQDFSEWNTEKSKEEYQERVKKVNESMEKSILLWQKREKEEQELRKQYIEEQQKKWEKEQEEERRLKEMKRIQEELTLRCAIHFQNELDDLRSAVVQTFLKKKELTGAQCAKYKYGDPLPED